MDLTHVIAERENKKIYRDGAKAIKVFAEGYSKADILNEALNTARVEETGLPIPKLLAVDTVNGQWAITTEFVEGDTLAETSFYMVHVYWGERRKGATLDLPKGL